MAVRSGHVARIGKLFRQFPVVAIVGPRQVGKTTLANQFVTKLRGEVHKFDLERPADLRKLADPMLALEDLELERMWVVHAGKETIKLSPKVTALPLRADRIDEALVRSASQKRATVRGAWQDMSHGDSSAPATGVPPGAGPGC